MKIADIKARQVFDSRGTPTVEVDIILESGIRGRAIVPSGASTGRYEALELRDNAPAKYRGKSVEQAIFHIRTEIRQALIGADVFRQKAIDRQLIELDGTPNKMRLGANATLGVSMAAAHAAANQQGIPLYRYLGGASARILPTPMIQILGGGVHAAGTVDLQDYLVIPTGSTSIASAMETVYNIYQAMRTIYIRKGYSTSVSDEGGFWPAFSSNEQGLKLLTQAIKEAGYTPLKDVFIALDVASSHFYHDGKYHLQRDNISMDTQAFVDLQRKWVEEYPILSLEDPCSEDDWAGWEKITKTLGERVQLIGDDLFTTNVERIRKGVEIGAANSVLIKMNQIGTLTETLEAIDAAKESGYLPVISARSGETEDVTMVDLAIATNAGQIKVGSITRSERLCKYNQMLRIEDELGENITFAGGSPFHRFIK